MIKLEREVDVFTLTMDAGENRWNTTFVREVAQALDEVEASEGAAALVTRSANEKFFSNGLDLDWVQAPDDHPDGGDRQVFGGEFMALMGRIITLPVPTVCAINGHAFGAGFMMSLCHDVRVMRVDRGFVCANEMQLGMKIPEPELALFRHKVPANAFFETVQLARRWAGPQALEAGIVQHVSELDELMPLATQKAQELAPLGANREIYGGQKERLFGENAALNLPHGAAYMLKNSDKFSH
ncbi:MAG: enoyl-CoA hydratase/isomerase family protein [Parvibaculaceae bacterium]|jgi:enoyl-CoA hydratase/carnithine racemase|nr:enoyl-CoA hydratase/isomerase family protein [Parvibaculaceae bacterium]